jgi:hypothetical protein
MYLLEIKYTFIVCRPFVVVFNFDSIVVVVVVDVVDVYYIFPCLAEANSLSLTVPQKKIKPNRISVLS